MNPNGRRAASCLTVFAVVVLLCVSGGCDVFESMGHGIMRPFRSAPSASQARRQIDDQEFPDERRIGIVTLVDFGYGKRPPYTDIYMRLAQNDPDYLVRATAIRALNRSRWQPAIPVFVAALDDTSDLVRLEACKALVHLPDDRAVPGLLKLVSAPDQNLDVRIAAADALQHYRQLEVARILVSQLNDRDFSVAWQAHASLCTLTGRDLDYSEGAWLNYLTGPERPLG